MSTVIQIIPKPKNSFQDVLSQHYQLTQFNKNTSSKLTEQLSETKLINESRPSRNCQLEIRDTKWRSRVHSWLNCFIFICWYNHRSSSSKFTPQQTRNDVLYAFYRYTSVRTYSYPSFDISFFHSPSKQSLSKKR